ncbi:MAG: pilus assembly protein TadE [Bacillota bacterium]|nr:pilus assembly protein TadE [Bacillota bacterium]
MQFKLKDNKRGSITVEASIIVPTVIISLIVLIYICVFLYQQSYIKSIANTAAQRGADVWNNSKRDMYIEYMDKKEIADTSLYWRFSEFISGGEKQKKVDKVNAFVKNSVSKYTILSKNNLSQLKSGSLSVRCDIDDYIIYKKLKVSIEEDYDFPLKGLLKSFGFESALKISANSEAVISDPVEFVRNTDFTVDTVREIDQKTGGKLEGVLDKVNGAFDKLSDKLKSFLY